MKRIIFLILVICFGLFSFSGCDQDQDRTEEKLEAMRQELEKPYQHVRYGVYYKNGDKESVYFTLYDDRTLEITGLEEDAIDHEREQINQFTDLNFEKEYFDAHYGKRSTFYATFSRDDNSKIELSVSFFEDYGFGLVYFLDYEKNIITDRYGNEYILME